MAKREKKGYSRLLYGEDEEIWEDDLQQESEENPPSKRFRIFLTILRIIIILLLTILILVWFINRTDLSPQNVSEWIHSHFIDRGDVGEFPVEIIGTSVESGNLYQADDFAAVLSDTALTVYNEKGGKIFSRKHSCQTPRMAYRAGRYLVYDVGGSSYQLQNSGGMLQSGNVEGTLLGGALSDNGKYALLTCQGDSSCRYTLYMQDGGVQYRYSLFSAQITALALSPDGNMGAFCALSSDDGEPVSKLYVLDFSQEEAVQEFTMNSNTLFSLYWADDGMLYMVGNAGMGRLNTQDMHIELYDFDAKTVSDWCGQGPAFAIALKGPSFRSDLLWSFTSGGHLFAIDCPARAVNMCVTGNTLAILAEDATLYCFDASTGILLGQQKVPEECRAIAMSDESHAFLLGVNRVFYQAIEE